MTNLQTCRLCKLSNYESKEGLVKYGVRHHAHLSCALTKWGAAFFDRLSETAIKQLPFITLDRFGLTDDVRARIKRFEEGRVRRANARVQS